MVTNKSYRRYTIISVFLAVYVILIGGLLYWVFKDRSLAEDNIDINTLQSPAIIIIAIVVSVLTFTVASAVFAALGKSNNYSALGMPDGSIRALIALSLITLFFILASQIYSRVSSASIGKLERMTEESIKELSLKDIISKEKTDSIKNPALIKDSTVRGLPEFVYLYTISVKVPTSSDAGDMAKNIIASFTALIAAISGFYFGSGAAKQSNDSKPDTKPDSPQPAKISPKTPLPSSAKKGEPINLEWEVFPPNQLITAQVIGDTSQPVTDSTNPLKFVYTPTATGIMVLKVSLKNNSSVSVEYKITITE